MDRKGIYIANHAGDQLLCTDGTTTGKDRVRQVSSEDDDGVAQVSWDALDAFMSKCIKQYGYTPMVTGRPTGKTDFELLHRAGRTSFETDLGQLKGIEEILVSAPFRGG